MSAEKKELESENEENPNAAAEGESSAFDELKKLNEKLQIDLKNKEMRISLLEKQEQDWRKKIDEIREYVKKMEGETQAIRERAQKEVESRVTLKLAGLLKSFLMIQDNLERSLESSKKSSNNESLVEGLALIVKQMQDTFKENQVGVIAALGETFDPQIHEAVSTQPVDNDAQEDKVIHVVQPGYCLGSHIIRPAQVIVGKKE